MNVNRFADNVSDCHSRVKARIRILKNHLHFAAVRKHINRNLVIFVKNHVSVINNFSVRRFVKAKKSTAYGCFSAAGFSDKTESFAFVNEKRNVVNGLNNLFVFSSSACGKVLLKMFNFKKLFRLCFAHLLFLPFLKLFLLKQPAIAVMGIRKFRLRRHLAKADFHAA